MIWAILMKEWTELRRDRRVVGLAWLIALLVLVALVAGGSTHSEQVREARNAQHEDREAFRSQGRKSPHSAAHFGRVAYKPAPALAVFDPGASPYLGQVIWLEAHRQDPAMFRPAEDSPALRRLSDLSVAGILTMLLPLIAFLMGYGAFAAERERGTLRQALSAGPSLGALFTGKLLITAVATVGIALSIITICLAVALTMSPARDTLLRGTGLMIAYALYGIIFAAVAVLVSSRARTASAALLVLLCLWAVSVVIAPRLAASVAARIHPTPDVGAFWADASRQIAARRLKRDSTEFRELERRVVSRALGRDVTMEELSSLRLSREAINLEIAEVRGAEVHGDAFRKLHATYERQQHVRRWFSILAPSIALQQLSAALSGTDIGAHRDFALQAEQQRNAIVRSMNEDMMLRGAGQGYDYVADRELWARIPDFHYRAPGVSAAASSGLWDGLILLGWSAAACALAWRAALRQS